MTGLYKHGDVTGAKPQTGTTPTENDAGDIARRRRNLLFYKPAEHQVWRTSGIKAEMQIRRRLPSSTKDVLLYFGEYRAIKGFIKPFLLCSIPTGLC